MSEYDFDESEKEMAGQVAGRNTGRGNTSSLNAGDLLYLSEFLHELADASLSTKGECGFGRPCVGIMSNEQWVGYNPYYSGRNGADFHKLDEYHDERLCPPPEVEDAYHKHQCFAVLAHGDPPDYGKALRQLRIWIEKLRKLGKPRVVLFDGGEGSLRAHVTGDRMQPTMVLDPYPPDEGRPADVRRADRRIDL